MSLFQDVHDIADADGRIAESADAAGVVLTQVTDCLCRSAAALSLIEESLRGIDGKLGKLLNALDPVVGIVAESGKPKDRSPHEST